ncbi:hypothetical protein KFU94_37805 [Chloroflexi bacterium TSY]|nr:hypothetical protein [Chloroflexi bacterium TSY]
MNRTYLLIYLSAIGIVTGTIFISTADIWGATTQTTAQNLRRQSDLAPLSNIIQIDAGDSLSCAVTSGGGVKCWGRNKSGQLGDSTIIDRSTPVDVIGLTSGVTAISAGWNHACAVTSGGGVKCWGRNNSGQLGDGTKADRHTPIDVSNLTNGVAAISTGENHTCALMSSGGVKCWGENGDGQLGDGSTTDRNMPVDVNGLTNGVSAISVGWNHVCALTNGEAKCWGDNKFNQLGDGSATDRNTPVDVSGLTSGVTGIAAGEIHTCAIISGGVKCWGGNGSGQLGDGTTTGRSTPTDVSGLTSGITAITIGAFHTCALTSNKSAKCWGDNLYGQLGDGTTSRRNTPVDVNGLDTDITAIAAGWDHTCVITNGGGMKCWGRNGRGQLGDGSAPFRSIPVDVSSLTNSVTMLVAGWDHACALTNTGGVKCWGYNEYGQLGNGTTTDSSTPVDVSGLTSGVTAITTGWNHSCALTTGEGVKCWGKNDSGQLGDDTTTNRSIPVGVSGLTSGVDAISAGENHTCALTNGGGVKCWGENGSRQLGDGTPVDRRIPTDVTGLTSSVDKISAGGSHSCAMIIGGSAKCWGENGFGQLGNGTTVSSSTPVDVSGLTNGIKMIATGWQHTCAVTNDDGVKCWGRNNNNQLGDGTTASRSTPVNVSGLTSGVTAISEGSSHTCAVMSGGARCWGRNNLGQLGDGTMIDRQTPISVSGLVSNVATISTGRVHTCSLTSDASIKCSGSDGHGQLGSNRLVLSSVPIDVLAIPCYTLSLGHTGDGSDPSASPPNSTGCGTGRYLADESISLSATPSVGWQVNGWSGTDNNNTTASSNTITMPAANHSVSVSYMQICYSLTLLKEGSGSVPVATPARSTSCGTGEYVAGEAISLNVSPDTNWAVDGWSGTDNDASNASTNSLTMPNAGHTATVRYTEQAPDCFELTLTHSGEGGDPVASPVKSDLCGSKGQYVTGESITLTAAPAEEWTVASWSGTDTNNSQATTNTLVMPMRNHAAAVTYEKKPIECYDLTLTHTGSGKNPIASPTFSPGCSTGRYVAGESIALTAEPFESWAVASWTGTANDASIATVSSLTMPSAAHTITVNYEQLSISCYALTLTVSGSGSKPTVTPTKSPACDAEQTFIAGATLTLDAMPSTDWSVSGWSGTDNDGSSSLRNTLTMPAVDHTVRVIYVEMVASCYTLSLSHEGLGSDPAAQPMNSTECPACWHLRDAHCIACK